MVSQRARRMFRIHVRPDVRRHASTVVSSGKKWIFAGLTSASVATLMETTSMFSTQRIGNWARTLPNVGPFVAQHWNLNMYQLAVPRIRRQAQPPDSFPTHSRTHFRLISRPPQAQAQKLLQLSGARKQSKLRGDAAAPYHWTTTSQLQSQLQHHASPHR